MKNNYRDKFREYLRNKNLKFTPERKFILDTVFSMHQHFDVEKLYLRMHRKHKDISRATLYRTLPLLVTSGMVRETVHCQDKSTYEHTYGHTHHDHLLCITCGKIIEFSEPEIEKLQDTVCRRYGFRPVEHRLGIKGYCRECRKRVKQNHLASPEAR